MERRYAGKLAYFCAMKIALAQQNYHIGNFSANVHKIVEAIAIARSKGADLILFSELAVCGYPPRDFLEFNDFIDKCKNLKFIARIGSGTENIDVDYAKETLNKNLLKRLEIAS